MKITKKTFTCTYCDKQVTKKCLSFGEQKLCFDRHLKVNYKRMDAYYKEADIVEVQFIDPENPRDMEKYARQLLKNPEDENRGVEWMKKAAEAGNPEAMNQLGLWYYNGDYTKKDDDRAFEYFKKAAEAGHSEAMHWLGGCYSSGVSVKRDKKMEIKWYKSAYSHGYTESARNVGVAYENIDTKEAMQFALDWYNIYEKYDTSVGKDIKRVREKTRTFERQEIANSLKMENSKSIEMCVVCMEDIPDKCIILDCKHSFHVDCICDWVTNEKAECPVCRNPVTKPKRTVPKPTVPKPPDQDEEDPNLMNP